MNTEERDFRKRYGFSSKNMLKLIDSKGPALVMARGPNGLSSFMNSIDDNDPVKAMIKLIKVGGRKLVMMQDNLKRRNALGFALSKNASVEVIMKLIEIGGKKLVMKTDNEGRGVLIMGRQN